MSARAGASSRVRLRSSKASQSSTRRPIVTTGAGKLQALDTLTEHLEHMVRVAARVEQPLGKTGIRLITVQQAPLQVLRPTALPAQETTQGHHQAMRRKHQRRRVFDLTQQFDGLLEMTWRLPRRARVRRQSEQTVQQAR